MQKSSKYVTTAIAAALPLDGDWLMDMSMSMPMGMFLCMSITSVRLIRMREY